VNKSNWWGRSRSLDESAHPRWIVHEMAISEGVDSALVLGDTWVMGQGCAVIRQCAGPGGD
jgi:hypothetical protein